MAVAKTKKNTALTNKAAVKRFILEAVKKHRSGWNCIRVSQGSLDDIEAVASAKIREWDLRVNYSLPKLPSANLLVRDTAKRFLAERHSQLFPWFSCKNVDDKAVEYIESRLQESVISMVKSHPSIGKTFKP